MRYYQVKHYSDSGSLGKQKKKKKNLFKEIMAENFPNKGTDKAYIKLYDCQIFNPKRFSWRDIIIYLSKVKGKQNFESNERKKTHHLQRKPIKALSRFLSRNLAA